MTTHPNATQSAPAIVVESLVKHFGTGPEQVTALDSVTLSFARGHLTLVAGPSGSGKSTLLAAISGLQRPDSGRVVALEQDLWTLSAVAVERFRLQHCGFVFQGFNLFAALTALEQVTLPLRYAGLSDPIGRARHALRAVDLDNRMHLRPAALSGGEKQRVAVARALAKEPMLIFADEPTSALDTRNGHVVMELLRDAADGGACVICVTHDLRLVDFADRVIHMQDGCVMSDEMRSRTAANPVLTMQPEMGPA